MPLPPPLRRVDEDRVGLFYESVASAHVSQLSILGSAQEASKAVVGRDRRCRTLTARGLRSRGLHRSRVHGRAGIPRKDGQRQCC